MQFREENITQNKSFDFSVRIVNLYKYILKSKNEFVLSKQLLRSGTSIGANVSEAQEAQSKADFVSKMNIALKESVETEYWLRLLYASEYINEKEFNSLQSDCKEVIRLLTSIVKTAKLKNAE